MIQAGSESPIAAEIGELILGDAGRSGTLSEADHLALVRRAAEADAATHRLLQHAVAAARADGISWAALGDELGLSRQGMQQRFGKAHESETDDDAEYRWLGPVTALDEMAELELAGKLGWRTVEAGMLRHKMMRTDTQWEHRRVLWTGRCKRYETDGWQVGVRAFPWLYLVRDLGTAPLPDS